MPLGGNDIGSNKDQWWSFQSANQHERYAAALQWACAGAELLSWLSPAFHMLQ